MRKCLRNLFFVRLGVLKWHHNRSQSPVFGLAVLYPIGSEICCFWYIKTLEGKLISKSKILLYWSVQWGDLIEQIKKSVIQHHSSATVCGSLGTVCYRWLCHLWTTPSPVKLTIILTSLSVYLRGKSWLQQSWKDSVFYWSLCNHMYNAV